MKVKWIRSPAFDITWILLPGLLPAVFILLFPGLFAEGTPVTLVAWFALVLLVDVGHVYSSLYRTYFDSQELQKHSTRYLLVPVLCWLVGTLLYSGEPLYFWRGLAYLAVFHFIRQQYGFVRYYSRGEKASPWARRIDAFAIYAASLYPMIYWHTHMPREFEWFVAGDFFSLPFPWLSTLAFYAYVLALLAYGLREIWTGSFNLPRVALVGGTALSWWVGIVHCNGDLPFTLANVVAHGIPYIALVWAYQKDRKTVVGDRFIDSLSRLAGRSVPVFLSIIIVLAFVEEGLWDGLVWRERAALFPVFSELPRVTSHATLSWLTPLLSLPQSTHYVLDGFLWRLR